MLCHNITPPGSTDPDTLKLRDTVNQIFSDKPFVLCQIGANDGISADPVFDIIKENKNIEAHLVEPQKAAFDLLTKNYKFVQVNNNDDKNKDNNEADNNENNNDLKEKIFFYNYALTNKNEKIKLYKNIADNGTDGHSSLLLRDLDIVNGTVVAKYTEEDYELVEGITVDNLQNKIKKNIDLLVIDTEGYDVEIVKMFFKSNILPKIIYFERPGISGRIPGEDILIAGYAEKYISEKLIEFNYVIEKLQDNWLCIKQ